MHRSVRGSRNFFLGGRGPRDILFSKGGGVSEAYFREYYNVKLINLNFKRERSGSPDPPLDPRMRFARNSWKILRILHHSVILKAIKSLPKIICRI